jgi:hypothetical protein
MMMISKPMITSMISVFLTQARDLIFACHALNKKAPETVLLDSHATERETLMKTTPEGDTEMLAYYVSGLLHRCTPAEQELVKLLVEYLTICPGRTARAKRAAEARASSQEPM